MAARQSVSLVGRGQPRSGRVLVEWEFSRRPDPTWINLILSSAFPVDVKPRVDGRRLRLAVPARDVSAAISMLEKAVAEAGARCDAQGDGAVSTEGHLRLSADARHAGQDLYERDLALLLGGPAGRRLRR